MSGLKHTRVVLSCFWLLLTTATLSAQGVFPVLISGVMIPPRSLDLSVYTTQRPTDLVFTVTLVDPVEPYRDIRLKLYIESNNQLIYITDPNAAVPVTRIFKDQPTVFNGFALQPYLQPSALIGGSGDGTGSVIIPEGFDRILVEVIDVQRNIPISRKAAVSGNFVLNDPPFTSIPTCGALLQYPATMNQLFNWMPRHIGSLNPPGVVQYTFKLVELLPGVGDPNDGFDNNLTIYQTTTFTPSLIYSVGQPHLEPNKLYAWRVQARSANSPGLYFRNNGYSNVCTFSYTTDSNGGGGSGGGSGSEEQRTPPTGCETFDTDFGPIAINDIVPALPTDGEVVKLGWFNLELSNVYSTGQGYSGEGLINVPFLASKIKVKFSNLKIKEGIVEKRVYEAASIRAVVDNTFMYDPSTLTASNLNTVFTSQYVAGLEQFFVGGGGQYRKLSGFDPQSPQATSLPMALDREIDGVQQPLIVVTGIRFTPRNAFMTCVAYTRGSGNSLLRYAAFEIPFAPFGVKNNSTLELLDPIHAPIDQAFTLSIDGGGMGTSCLGFKNYDLNARVEVNPAVLAKASDNSTIRVGFSQNTSDPATYLGNINDFASFKAPQLPGFTFSMNNGKLDLRTGEKLSLQNLESIFQPLQQNSWRGLYLDGVSVKLPAEYDFTGNQQGITLDKGALSVQEGGLTGRFRKTGIVSLANGKLGTWRYSVDTMALTIIGSQTSATTLSGLIRVPLLDEPFKYQSQLNINSSETELLVKPAPGVRAMAMWGGQLNVNDSTVVTAKLREVNGTRQFFPYAEIFGRFSATVDAAKFEQYLSGNKAQAIAQIKQVLDVQSVNLQIKNARFSGFKADPYALPAERYVMAGGGLDSVIIGGKSFIVGELSLQYHAETPSAPEELGLKIVALAYSSLAQITLWAKANEEGGFQFNRIEIATENVTCNCHSLLFDRSGDDTRMGQIQLESYYEKNYGPSRKHLDQTSKRGGARSTRQTDTGLEALEAAYREAVMSRLEAGKVGGFIVDDQILVLPWGDKLKISSSGGTYTGDIAIARTANNFTFEGIDANSAAANPGMSLPIDLTQKLSAMKITKNQAWPANDHVRFLLTKFEIAANQITGPNNGKTIAPGITVSAEFTLLVKISNAGATGYAQFVTATSGKISATGVDLKDFFLYLDKDFAMPGFSGGASLTLKKVDESSPATGSYAKIDCNGFQGFNVQSEMAFPESKVKKPDGSVFSIGATILGNNLNRFIAPVNATSFAFTVPGVEQLIFEGDANKSFTIYLDHDDTDNAEDCAESKDFRGLFLKEVKARLEGFTMNEDNRDLFFNCTNFTLDPVNGLSGKVDIRDFLKAESNSSIGGWAYTLDQIAFEFEHSALSKNSAGQTGISLTGTIKMPLIPGTTMLGFKGTVSYDNTIKGPVGNLEFDASAFANSYAPEAFPGFAFQFQQGSAIGLRYQRYASTPPAGQNNQGTFVPFANLSGNAAVALTAPFEMAFDQFSFQNLTINDPDDQASDIPAGRGAAGGPIKRIKLGIWGTRASGGAPPPMPEGKQPAKREGLQGFPITINGVGFQNIDGKPSLGITFGVNLMKNNNNAKGKGSSGGTAGLSGNTTLAFPLTLDGGWMKADGNPILKDVDIEGTFGPVGIKGALKTMAGDSKWGNGFKAKINVDVKAFTTPALAQFGITNYNNSNNDFRYFFLDVESTSEAGLPLLADPIKVNMHAVGGGFYYNMQVQAPATERTLQQRPEPSNYLEPGASLSGFAYEPKNNSFGGNFKSIMSVVQAQTLMFDGGLGMTIQVNGDGTLAFSQLAANGAVQMMPQTVATRRETALAQGTANVVMDFNTSQIAGAFNFAMNYPVGTQPDLFGIKATAQAAMMINFKEGKWYLKCGRPVSGQYMQSDLTLFKNTFGKTETYFQTGHDLDPAPNIAALVPNWSAGGQALGRSPELTQQQGNGAVFGLKCNIPKQRYDYLSFYAALETALGFDLSMTKRQEMCNGKPVGINGWWMSGPAYSYITGSMGMHYSLGALKGDVNIMSINMATVMQAKIANPAELRARLKGSFSVMGGLVKGNVNFMMVKRSDADAPCLDQLEPNTNSALAMKLVSETYPNEQGAKTEKFQIFGQPRIVLNVPLAKILEFEDVDKNGKATWRRYKPNVSEFSVKRNGIAIPGKTISEAYTLTFQPDGLLAPQTAYALTYKIQWQELNADGSVRGDLPNGLESKTITFTTDKMPDKIVTEALGYHAPGLKQRYWTKGYADPRIAFKAGDWTTLFPVSKKVNLNGVNTDITFDYLVRLTEYSNGNEGATTDIPLSEAPGLQTFAIPTRTVKTIGTKFRIPYVETKQTQGLNVAFAGLNDLNLKKGSLYKLQVIRKPVLPAAKTRDLQQTPAVGDSSKLTLKIQTIGTAVEGPLASEFKILYEYWFGVSQFDNLADKLAKSVKKWQPSSLVRQSDMGHPRDAVAPRVSMPNTWPVKDDYYTFEPVNGEGFDSYDLDRIQLNMAPPKYLAAWGPVEKFYPNDLRKMASDARKSGGPAVPSILEIMRSANNTQVFDYLDVVLEKYTNVKDWHYHFNLIDNPYFQLTDNEIGQQKMDATFQGKKVKEGAVDDVFASNVNFSMVYHDARSRIVAHQIKFSEWVADYVKNGNPTLYQQGFKGAYVAFWKEGNATLRAAEDTYGPNYRGGIELKFPKLSNWKNMDQKLENPESYPALMISLPARAGGGTGK